jgi:Putative MetA-pathway of phenol degradation
VRGRGRPLRFVGIARIWLPPPALAAALYVTTATAQGTPRDPHAVQPERPTVATHAYTVSPGWVEVEAGVEADRYAGGAQGGIAPILVKVGLAPTLQLDLSGSLLHPPTGTATGVGDLALGLKWHWLAGGPAVGDLAVVATIKVPTAPVASGLGTGTTDASLVLVSSRQLGPVEMDLNVGATRRSGTGATVPRSATVWTASFGGPLLGRMGWVTEVYGYPGTSGAVGQSPIVALLAGPTLLPHAWLAFDAGVIIPLDGPQPRALYAGAVYNVGHL